MEKCITYLIDVELLKERGSRVCELIGNWLKDRGIDAMVYDFVLDNDGSIIIDYSFDEEVKYDRVKQLTEQILDKLNIKYTIG